MQHFKKVWDRLKLFLRIFKKNSKKKWQQISNKKDSRDLSITFTLYLFSDNPKQKLIAQMINDSLK